MANTYGNSNVALFLAAFGSNGINTTGNISARNFTGNGAYLRNIIGANVVGQVSFANTANNVDVANVTGIGDLAVLNSDGNASNVLYGNGVFAAVTGATTANIVAVLANLGSNSISTSGNITAGNIIANGSHLTSLSGANVTGQVPFASVANRVAVANVQGIGNLAVLNRDGNASNVLYGNGVFAPIAGGSGNYGNTNVASFLSNYGSNTITTTGNIVAGNITAGNIIANGSRLTSVTGANVTGQVPYAGIANSVAIGNVQGIGNIATINRDGNASNVLYGNGVFAAAPSNGSNYGNTNVAAYLASYGSNTITTTGNIVSGNIVTNNITSNFVGNGTRLTNIPGANVTGQVPYAGIANSVAIGNVQGIGNLAVLNRDGNASNVLYGNGVFAPVAGGGSNYGNTNVAAYLASYGSNTITTTGNVSVGNIIGNGQALSGIVGANVTGTVGYAVTAYSVAVGNVAGIGNIATINRDGNASNVLYGNGQFSAAPAAFTNAKVASFLASYGSNTITTTGNISVGNITATNLGNVSRANFDGNYQNVLYGNGVFAAGGGTSSYGNSNVINLLVSFGNNRISTTGNVNVGNIVGNGQALSGLRGSNIVGAVQYATIANAVAVANVSGIGNIATINKDGNANHVLFGNGVFASIPGTTIGGSNTQLQYNNAGNLGGISTVTYDHDDNLLSLGNVSNVNIGGGVGGYILQTDGSGGLSWVPQSTYSGTVATYNVSDITTANPAVATTATNHSFVNGTTIVFVDAAGSTDWANINNITYYAGNVTANTFKVYTDYSLTTGLDTSTFSNPYTAGSANVLYVVSSNPAGANGEIQYNNAGQLGGSSKFKVDDAAGNLSVTGNIIASQSVRVSGSGGNITGAVDIIAVGNVIAANVIADFAVANTLTSNLVTTDQVYFSNTGPVTISSGNDLNFSASGSVNYLTALGLVSKTNNELANLAPNPGSIVYNTDEVGISYFDGVNWLNLSSGNVPAGNNIVATSVTTNSLVFSGVGPVIINSGSDLTFQPAGQVVFGSLAAMVSMTTAQLANVGATVGSFAYCTDASGGPCPVYYDGTNWLKFSDNGSI